MDDKNIGIDKYHIVNKDLTSNPKLFIEFIDLLVNIIIMSWIFVITRVYSIEYLIWYSKYPYVDLIHYS